MPNNKGNIDSGLHQSQNWKSLADHLQAKVQKRTGEVSYLHTKIGFLVAANAILMQSLVGINMDEGNFGVVFLSGLTLATSLLFALRALFITKSPSALNADDMITYLLENPGMTEPDFQRWLAKSYARTNNEFNKVYNATDNKIRWSAVLFVASFGIILVGKVFQS